MKANWQKKNALFWTTFFLTILEAGASAVEPVGLQLSYKKRLPVVYKYFKVKLVVFYVLNLPI